MTRNKDYLHQDQASEINTSIYKFENPTVEDHNLY